MKECTNHIHRFSTQNDRRIKKVCNPLLQSFGIDTFWYYTLSPEGYFSYLGNQGILAEFFSDEMLYRGHPHYRHPKFFKNNTVYSESFQDLDFLEQQAPLRETFNLTQLCIVIQKEGEKLHGYGFATMNQEVDLTSTYLNQQPLLRSFISYFREEMKDLIDKTQENQVNLAPYCGESFFRRSPIDDQSISSSKATEFLQHIKKDSLGMKLHNTLSRRELECLEWLLKGRSARQIGEELNLSKRTIEEYLENIKNKLGCITKTEVFDQAILLKQMGYL
jgi:DNA-binding CsgD family transcriptional regulator